MKHGAENYLKVTKQTYHDSCRWDVDKRVAIFGYGKDNIGEAIAKELSTDHKVECYTEQSCFLGSDIQDIDLNQYNVYIFNNGATRLDWIEDQEYEWIERQINSNFAANVYATREIVKKTLGNKEIKIIIYIGSMAHNHVLNGSAVYCATKAAMNMFARCAAHELTPKGYYVYCINPSNVVNAPMSFETIQGLQRYRGLTKEEAIEYWHTGLQMDQHLTKRDIGCLVKYLMKREARYLSGSPIDLSGGQR